MIVLNAKLTIKTARTKEDAALIAALAQAIWTEHYDPIIGPDQVRYMLRKFQSAERIYKDFTGDGYRYMIAFAGKEPAGYCAIKPDEHKRSIFLSKIYVDKRFRCLGIARRMIAFFLECTKAGQFDSIWLTVNKHNESSIAAYRKLGFEIDREAVTDIGSGYIMDDYIMKKLL